MAKVRYTWFIEPLDSHTNEVLARRLPEENASCHTLEDGQEHNLWQCASDFVWFLKRSQENLALRFKVYNKAGQGKIRICPEFLFRKTWKRKKLTKALK